jgi:hypothetical protein
MSESEAKYINALRIVKADLEYPNRELRIIAQCEGCSEEVQRVLNWLIRELEREIDLQEMFGDAFSDIVSEPY